MNPFRRLWHFLYPPSVPLPSGLQPPPEPTTKEGWRAETEAVRAMAVPCPRCGTPTRALKEYDYITLLVFVIVFGWYRHMMFTACASCMRKRIARDTLITLVPANIVFPLVVLINGSYWMMSFTPGHSDSVAERLRVKVRRQEQKREQKTVSK